MLDTIKQMEFKARQAAEQAYCPYSDFRVGAAVLGDDGNIYVGCNVENAAYGSTLCAERNAITAAIAGGVKQIKALMIYTPTEQHAFPCGNCRQFINEFASDLPIISICNASEKIETSLKALLPNAFGPHNLCSIDETMVA